MAAYILPRSGEEIDRLATQHQGMLDFMGRSLLEPEIVASIADRDNVRIGDVGTGTEVWLLDVAARTNYGSKFVGLDISDAQFPPESKYSTLRKHIEFHTFDLLKPVEER